MKSKPSNDFLEIRDEFLLFKITAVALFFKSQID